MLDHSLHYKNIEKAINQGCTCEIIKAIADICRKKAEKTLKADYLTLSEKNLVRTHYLNYADYLENFVVVADLPCPSQVEEDILTPDSLGDFT